MKKRSLTNKTGTVKELTRADIRAMRPAKDVLSKHLLGILPKRKRGERGLQKEPKKISVTVRYSPEVVKYFKDTGEGWQTRMDDVLKNYIKKKNPKRAA
jgi:uncharacterized protein (DUF4415 family)